MSSSSFRIALDFGSSATRESGARARLQLLQALKEFHSIVLDFKDANPTPSFVDESIGRLAESLGERTFRAQVRIVNVLPDVRPLLQQVLQRRLRGTRATHVESCSADG